MDRQGGAPPSTPLPILQLSPPISYSFTTMSPALASWRGVVISRDRTKVPEMEGVTGNPALGTWRFVKSQPCQGKQVLAWPLSSFAPKMTGEEEGLCAEGQVCPKGCSSVSLGHVCNAKSQNPPDGTGASAGPWALNTILDTEELPRIFFCPSVPNFSSRVFKSGTSHCPVGYRVWRGLYHFVPAVWGLPTSMTVQATVPDMAAFEYGPCSVP